MRDGRAGEILLDQGPVQPDRLENLGAVVALEGGNAHLREHLEQALVDRLLVVLQSAGGRDVGRERAAAVEFLDGLDGEVRVDGAGAVADQEGKVHDLARFAGFHDECHLRARRLAHEVVVHRRERQQARDRRVIAFDAAVREDQQAVARADGERRAAAKTVQRPLQLLFAAFDPVQHRERGRQEIAPGHAAELLQVEVGQDGVVELQACGSVAASRPSRLRSVPMKLVSDMTSSSRIGSIAGLVTWANSCLK